MSEVNIINHIADELKIERFQEESLEIFYSRVIYSAMAFWTNSLSFRENSSEGSIGISKTAHHRKLREILENYASLCDLVNEYFAMDSSYDALNDIRHTLLYSGDICEIGFTSRLVLPESRSFAATATSYFIQGETIVPPSGRACGLAWLSSKQVADNSEDCWTIFHIPRKTAAEKLNERIAHSKWKELKNTDGFEWFDPKRKSVLSDCWDTSPVNCSGQSLFIARKQLSFGNYDYFFIRQKSRDRLLFSKVSDLEQRSEIRETQRYLYGLKEKYGLGAHITVDHYQIYTVWRFWSKLPPAEETLLRYIAWPMQNLRCQKNEFLVRNELNPIIEKLCSGLGLVREDRFHE